MIKELPVGTMVHYDSDNKEWGERIVGNGTILGKTKRGKYRVFCESVRAELALFRREFYVMVLGKHNG